MIREGTSLPYTVTDRSMH